MGDESLKEEILRRKVLEENSLALVPVIGLMGQVMQLTSNLAILVFQQAARLDALAAHVSAQESLLEEVLGKSFQREICRKISIVTILKNGGRRAASSLRSQLIERLKPL